MAAPKFVKPAGENLSGPVSSISKTIQKLPANGVLVVGVSGSDGLPIKVGPNDPSAASVDEIGRDSGSGVRWFQLVGKRAGNVIVDIRGGDGGVLDYFQLAMSGAPAINLPRASTTMEFEFEPDDPKRPGQINVRVYTPLNEKDYVDNRLEAVGWSIYLFGCHLYCSGLTMPVMVPDSHIDFKVTNAVAVDTVIYPDRASADAAIQAAPAAAPGVTRYAFYRGAGGALIVPTVFSPATTPRTIQTLLAARVALAEQVQHDLVILALSLVGGMVLKSILTRVLRVGSETPEPSGRTPPPVRLQPAMARLQATARNIQNQEAVRTAEVLTQPKVYRHTLTRSPQFISYARIEQQGAMELSTGANAHYGEGVYAWKPGQTGVGTYVDIEVPAGTGVETIQVNGQTYIRMVPPEGNTLPVKIVDTNMPQSQIDMGRSLVKPGQ